MIAILMLIIEIANLFILIKLLKKGSFVTVKNEVIYVPANKSVRKKPSKVYEDDDTE